MLDLCEYCEHFSITKIYEHETIWKAICRELGWPIDDQTFQQQKDQVIAKCRDNVELLSPLVSTYMLDDIVNCMIELYC